MGDKTAIEWTDATWNPVTGCTKVSPGCDHCYAERVTERFQGPGSFATVQRHPDRLDLPLRWRKPRRIFVNSMSDLFHADVPDDYIAGVFAVMALTQVHSFQVLTKRHARMRALVNDPTFWQLVSAAFTRRVGAPSNIGRCALPNVWLGVSVEDQKWAEIRVPALLETPAAVRFISAEPLLGPVTLRPEWLHSQLCPMRGGGPLCACIDGDSRLDWVIVGGESGPRARPMHPRWARDLRDQCGAADVPFLFKQWGEWAPRPTSSLRAGELFDHAVIVDPRDLDYGVMRRVGKKNAGRVLDGETWDEYPAGTA